MLVKTYPNPSRKASEAVCTAGIDSAGRWARLFPIPFRTLEESQRFAKWQWIEARVRKAPNDPRPESHEVEYDSIRALAQIPAGAAGWRERWRLVNHLLRPSLESVIDSGSTLGLIKPSNYSIVFEDVPEPHWTPEELGKLQGGGKVNLFGRPVAPARLLQKLPVRFRYVFDCSNEDCRHRLIFEDWEVCESWRKWKQRYATRPLLEAAIENKYADEPARKGNLYLFVGNIAAHPKAWLVIGQIQPNPQVLSA
ncbi:MAG TPA: hypothetical protein VIX83_03210 [Candidatus Cybelea sp.]